MKKHLILVITLVLGLFGLALAAYDARLAELKQELKAEPGITEEDTRALTNMYDEYNKERNSTFTALLEMLQRTDTSPQASNYWTRAKALYDVIDGRKSSLREKLSKSGENLFVRFTTAEFLFNLRLTTTKLPVRRDEIVTLNANLTDYTNKLDEKWKSLNSTDQSYDEQEKAIARELRGIVEEMIKEVAESNKNLQERFGQAASLGADFIPVVGKLVEKTIEKIVERQNYILKRMNEYRNLVNYEKNGIFVLFDQTYYDTKKFIEQNGFDVAKEHYAKAREDAEALAAQGPNGVRADAKEFADQALKALSDHLAKMESTFNRFVTAHKGKFFGPVGPDLEEALVETRAWEQETNDVKRLDLEGKLRAWRENVPQFLSQLDRSGLSEATRKTLKENIEKNLEALVKAIKGSEEALSNQFWVVNYDRSELARQIKNNKN